MAFCPACALDIDISASFCARCGLMFSGEHGLKPVMHAVPPNLIETKSPNEPISNAGCGSSASAISSRPNIFYRPVREMHGIAKISIFLFFLGVWLIVGGVLTFGPRFGHNADQYLGMFVIKGTFYSWVAIPIFMLVFAVDPSSRSRKFFEASLLVWGLFVTFMWLRVIFFDGLIPGFSTFFTR